MTISRPAPFTVLINKPDDYKNQRRQLIISAPLIAIGLIGVLCLISYHKSNLGPTELYLGSSEEDNDAQNIGAASQVDDAAVKVGMPEVDALHNPDAEEFKQAVAEQASESKTNADFLKGAATDAPKKKASGDDKGKDLTGAKAKANAQQTLKASVTAPATTAKTTVEPAEAAAAAVPPAAKP